MTFGGLYLRLFNQTSPIQSLIGWWIRIVSSSSNLLSPQIDVPYLAWPLLAIGLAWSGALSALWQKLRWASSVTIFLGVLSLLTFGLGTLLALLVLICLRMPATYRWLKSIEELDDTRMGTLSIHR
jgi:sulfite exporter TauE/SafE